MTEIRFTLRLPEDLHITLKNMADAAGRSLNEQIVYSLTRYIGVIDELERRIADLEAWRLNLSRETTTKPPLP